MTVAFDTLKLADRLEAAGKPSRQAQDVAAALAKTLAGAVATAADLRESELRLRGKISESESRLRSEIANVRGEIASVRTEIAGARTEILKWVIIGAIGFQTVVILGAVAALIRLLH
jgi:hypothetical protein